ncbi:cytochrome P450 [Mycolicibacterium goodii]|uniref:cytochrome P450 n=1 Tax=Mycolicibacterium goodii TaxID=134601 RepID=UPI001BDD8FE7|nr:cytochrome P450 [Mycolicibacterium goodii]MBU8808258.1 cytochrome P450 [Mycolicibacterium goodii]MBU8833197.1 cytochrome P450 [Mycolicibacterium goodii]
MTSIETRATNNCPPTRDYLPWKDPQLRVDPYPFYARALDEAPVSRDEDGTYVLTKFEDLMHYGRLPSVIISTEWEKAGAWRIFEEMALGHDEPHHTRLRRMTSKWLTPKRVQDWVKITAAVTDEILDRVGDDGLVDGSDLGVEATHVTVCRLLQVPEDDIESVRREMRKAMPVLSAVPDAGDFEACDEAHEYMRARTKFLIEHSRANPGDGLLDHLLALQDSGEMTEAEVFATTLFFYFVGHMDASYLISSGLHLFTRRQDIFDAFRHEPEVRQAIVTELVRYDAPEPVITRTTTEDLVIRGVHVPAGSRLRLVMGAANRDPDVFDSPHEFDFRRPPEQSRNLTFSFGSHSCQGRLLAEAEVRVVWERIAARYSRVELAGEPVIKNTDASRHYYSLPLRLCP